MKPSSTRRSVIVGLFITFALAILAGAVLAVGNLKNSFTQRITVTAVFDEVNGLKVGDNIWFSGVKVGIVKELGFHGAAQVEVSMRIDRDAAHHIRYDALATIGSDGLIGNRIVVLEGGSPQARDLAEGDVLQIGTTTSTEALMAVLTENNNNLLAITTDMRGITHKLAEGEGTIGKLLADDQLYAKVTDTVSTLSLASTQAQSATSSLSSFAKDLNREGSLPKDLVTDRSTYAELTSAVGQLQDASASASELVDGLAAGAKDPNTALGVLTQDAEVGATLKSTLDKVHTSSDLLAEDLEAIQHNVLFRRTFRRQARAEAKAEAKAEAAGEKERP